MLEDVIWRNFANCFSLLCMTIWETLRFAEDKYVCVRAYKTDAVIRSPVLGGRVRRERSSFPEQATTLSRHIGKTLTACVCVCVEDKPLAVENRTLVAGILYSHP